MPAWLLVQMDSEDNGLGQILFEAMPDSYIQCFCIYRKEVTTPEKAQETGS